MLNTMDVENPQPFHDGQQQVPSNELAKKSSKTPILILILIIVAVALSYGSYYYGHRDVSNLNQRISILQSQIQSLNTGLQKANKSSGSVSTSTSNSNQLNQNLIKIPTLGIQMYVPDSIKDLTITPVQSPGYYNGQLVASVTVATSTISNDIPQCKNDAFGTLTKYTGEYPSSGVDLTIWHKQFAGFYLTLSPGEASCAPPSTSQINQNLLQSQSAVFDAALPSITTL